MIGFGVEAKFPSGGLGGPYYLHSDHLSTASLITDLQLNTWYVLRIEVHDGEPGFYVEVYQENNPKNNGSYRVSMPAGKAWRFHYWVYRGNAYLDDYREYSETLSAGRNYAYNQIGNLTSKTGLGSYQYWGGKPHAVTHINNAQKYWYDANGNMTTRKVGSVTYNQSFNAESKLAGVSWPGNSASFTYDGDGNRLLKTENGVTTLYIGDIYEKIVGTPPPTPTPANTPTPRPTPTPTEMPPTPTPIATATPYLKLTPYPKFTPYPKPTLIIIEPPPNFLSQPSNQQSTASAATQTLGEVTKYYHFNGQRVAMRRNGEVYYLHSDHLGTASLTTDANGAVKHQVRHYPFGGQRWSSGSDVSDYDFTGQRLDGFGLLDYNARYYDSVIGRFISADTVVPDFANPQDLNRYSYVRNNPVKFRDPSGHAVECSGGIGGCGWQPANSGVYSTVAAQNAIDTTGEIAKFYAVAALTLVGADFIADGAETVGHIASGNYGSAAISGIATAAPWIPASFVNDIPGMGWLGSKIDEGLGLLGRNGNELELAYAASSSNRLPSPGRRQPGGPSSPSGTIPKNTQPPLKKGRLDLTQQVELEPVDSVQVVMDAGKKYLETGDPKDLANFALSMGMMIIDKYGDSSW